MMSFKNAKNIRNIKVMYAMCLAIMLIMCLCAVCVCSMLGADSLSAVYLRDVYVDTMGMLVGGILVMGLITEKNADKLNRNMFRIIFTLNILFFMDILSSVIEDNSKYIIAIKLVNTLIFVFEDMLGYCFWAYIREELNLKGRYIELTNKICVIILSISILMDILNWIWGYYFTVSAAGQYVDGPFEAVGDISIMAIFIIADVAIISVKDIRINEKIILLTFSVLPFVAYAIGSYSQEYSWVLPAYLLSVMLIYIRIFSKRGQKLAEQQVVLSKQSTALMISQIQPHFLYNVLTTISNLCVTDPEEAEETTVLFSQYLRTNLDSLRNDSPVPFATELGHIRTYVELEKKRFGDKLNVEYDIEEVNFKVPSLGLQPIVENSIKHGIRGKNEPGHIKIKSFKVGGGAKVIIEDDGIGFDMNAPVKDDGRSHVGMVNVRERLRQMVNASVEIESSPGNGCRTEIFIPEE